MGKRFNDLTCFEELLEANNRNFPLEPFAGVKTKINHLCIICGFERLVMPDTVLQFSGCPSCADNLFLTESRYAEKRKEKGITSVFPLEASKGSTIKIQHGCVCGNIFPSSPDGILGGRGCPPCGRITQGTKQRITNEEYDSILIELGRFDVIRLEPLDTVMKKIFHGCQDCGFKWNVRPGHIMDGSGCPKCAKTGFHPDKPASLYIYEIKHEGKRIIKVGITRNDSFIRIQKIIQHGNNLGKKITTKKINEFYFQKGLDALNIETEIKRKFQNFNDPIFEFATGWTEMFSFQIKKELLNFIQSHL